VKLTEKNFIELLRKSDSFTIKEAFSKVKNAEPIAIFESDKSLVLKDTNSKQFYYASYTLDEGFVNLTDIEPFDFEEMDYKKVIKENIEDIFSSNSDKSLSALKKSIREIIYENSLAKDKIDSKINDLMKEEHITYINKPKFVFKKADEAKAKINKLKESDYFKQFAVQVEKKNLTPLVLEQMNWEKDSAKLFRNKINYKEDKVISEGTKYSLKGLKKAQITAKGYWKDVTFRKRLKEAINDEKMVAPFLGRYKNMTLLGEEALIESLSKALLAISESNKIDSKLKSLMESIKKNKNMITWGKLTEAPLPGGEAMPASPEAADTMGADAMGTETGTTAPEAVEPPTDEAELPEEPTDETAGLGTEEDLATESSKEVAIINALLGTIEEIFWNGNQENKELANLIKELRDMREGGEFDENRLEEIFKDLFSVTQQIQTAGGEEEVGEEELAPTDELPVEGAPGEVPATPEVPAAEPSPLENY
jgi:hypothetical protein